MSKQRSNKVRHLRVRTADCLDQETVKKLMLLRGNLVSRELARKEIA